VNRITKIFLKNLAADVRGVELFDAVPDDLVARSSGTGAGDSVVVKILSKIQNKN
jgi:hypothetical protein